MSGVRFRLWMIVVTAVAAGVQALFIHAMSRRASLSAGARFIAGQARLLVRGAWFVSPAQGGSPAHALVPTAIHPPLPTLLFAIADAASATGSTAHRLFLAILFVVSVVLAGLTVRDLAGERAGILAALVFATCPFLWVNPATLGPETTVVVTTTLLLFVSVRFWTRPNVKNAATVGLSLGLCVLTRTDLLGLVVLLVLPLAFFVKNTSWPARIRYLGVVVALLVLVAAPWVVRNQLVVSRSTVISEDFGPVLAGANCPATYAGDLEGWWSAPCAAGSRSTQAAWDYFSAHQGDSVGVAAVRLGRVWNVYRPLQGIELETAVGRPAWVSRLGLWYFYAMVPVAAAGAVVLRRRRTLVFPFIAMIALSSLTAIFAYGDARFAVEGEVALAMLAGVALDALAKALRSPVGAHQRRAAP